MAVCAGGLAALVIAACGGGGGGGGGEAKTAAPEGAQKGGTLTVLSNADVD